MLLLSKENGCVSNDLNPDDHANIEVRIHPNDDSNNLCECDKSCRSIEWGSRAIPITNGNDNNFFVNQHQWNKT